LNAATKSPDLKQFLGNWKNFEETEKGNIVLELTNSIESFFTGLIFVQKKIWESLITTNKQGEFCYG